MCDGRVDVEMKMEKGKIPRHTSRCPPRLSTRRNIHSVFYPTPPSRGAASFGTKNEEKVYIHVI